MLNQDILSIIDKYLDTSNKMMLEFTNKLFKSVKTKFKIVPYSTDLCKYKSMLKWYVSKYKINAEIYNEVIKNGDLELIEWFDLEVTQKLKHCGGHVQNKWTIVAATKTNDLGIIRWVYLNNCSITDNALANAIKFCDFYIIKWMHEEKFPLSDCAFAYAVERGDFEIMEWLYDKKCPWSNYTMSVAAYKGDLEIIKWLHEKQCPYDHWVFISAMNTKQITILEWFLEHNYPWSPYIFSSAVNSSEEIKEWIYDNLIT
jgi:hypothetical protein